MQNKSWHRLFPSRIETTCSACLAFFSLRLQALYKSLYTSTYTDLTHGQATTDYNLFVFMRAFWQQLLKLNTTAGPKIKERFRHVSLMAIHKHITCTCKGGRVMGKFHSEVRFQRLRNVETAESKQRDVSHAFCKRSTWSASWSRGLGW